MSADAKVLRRSLFVVIGLLFCGPEPGRAESPATGATADLSPTQILPDEARIAYLDRVHEVQDWLIDRIDPDDLTRTMGTATIITELVRGVDIERCNQRTIGLMADPKTGPFWMFPVTMIACAGRDRLSEEARQSIRDAWRTTRQLRGDTENHWIMYYVSLFLMSELYPDESGDTWFTGKSSSENLEEARGFILDWIETTITIGQGEYNSPSYICEYAITMIMLATWAEEPAMRLRGQMMLDWMFAELATVTLDGILRGPNSRTSDAAVVERWNSTATALSWLLFGNTFPTRNYGGWMLHFVPLAENYEVPEVIRRIAVDRQGDILQKDRARSRRRWRFSDPLSPPIYKTQYLRRDYAVGSYQGGLSDPIQTHVWDVTWSVPDPRGVHPTLFSMHPHSSGKVMQMFFSTYPDPMPVAVAAEGKPSYDLPDKVLGCSPYEQVFQDLDTVIALYDIEPGERFPHINGYFSQDLADLEEDASGWIFARGGRAYLAYRPLAPYRWIAYGHYTPALRGKTEHLGGKLLQSPYLKNGTIVQVAGADEFATFAEFKTAIRGLPLQISLDPVPAVRMATLRGRQIEFTYGEAPVIDGQEVDYDQWKLFEGPHLNAEVGGRRLTITHGQLERILDFNTLAVTDRITDTDRPDDDRTEH